MHSIAHQLFAVSTLSLSFLPTTAMAGGGGTWNGPSPLNHRGACSDQFRLAGNTITALTIYDIDPIDGPFEGAFVTLTTTKRYPVSGAHIDIRIPLKRITRFDSAYGPYPEVTLVSEPGAEIPLSIHFPQVVPHPTSRGYFAFPGVLTTSVGTQPISLNDCFGNPASGPNTL